MKAQVVCGYSCSQPLRVITRRSPASSIQRDREPSGGHGVTAERKALCNVHLTHAVTLTGHVFRSGRGRKGSVTGTVNSRISQIRLIKHVVSVRRSIHHVTTTSGCLSIIDKSCPDPWLNSGQIHRRNYTIISMLVTVHPTIKKNKTKTLDQVSELFLDRDGSHRATDNFLYLIKKKKSRSQTCFILDHSEL